MFRKVRVKPNLSGSAIAGTSPSSSCDHDMAWDMAWDVSSSSC